MKKDKIILGLNTNKILDHWRIEDALRELVSNAYDEHKLAHINRNVVFDFEGDKVIIQDFGRGIKQRHFIYNIDKEKRNANTVSGKFGFGLKDALSRLYGVGKRILIQTKDYKAEMKKVPKGTEGDEEIAVVLDPNETNTIDCGTKITIWSINKSQYDETKNNVLWLQEDKPKTLYEHAKGEVLEKQGSWAKIFLHGIKVHTESNLTFSYNIKTENTKIKQGLNRDRKTLDRQQLKLAIESVLDKDMPVKIAEEILNQQSYEYTSKIIRTRIFKILRDKKVFVTKSELHKASPYEKKVIQSYDQNQGGVIEIENKDRSIIDENKLRGKDHILKSEGEKYSKYDLVDPSNLTELESNNYNWAKEKLEILDPKINFEIMVNNLANTLGMYEKSKNSILIDRHIFKDRKELYKTLLHEFACSLSGAEDLSKEFQNDLLEAAWIFENKKG